MSTTGSDPGHERGVHRLLGAAVMVAVLGLAGRLAGFGRELLLARYFGASAETDAYLVAWTIPETASPLLQDVAVIYALVPLFMRARAKNATARMAVERSMGPVLVVLTGFSVLVAAAAPLIVAVLTPELAEPDLAVRCVRAAAPTVLALGLTGLLTAVLRSYEVFAVTAAVSVVYNVGIIGSILLLREEHGVFAAAVGLTIGGFLMVAMQLPAFVRRIGVPRLSLSKESWRYVRREFAPLLPIGAFVLLRHAQVFVERFLGSFIEPGAISYLAYSTRIAQVPMGIALAVAIVSFPDITGHAAAGRLDEMRRSFERNAKLITALIVPAIVVLVIFAGPIVETLLQHGNFTAEDTRETAGVLQLYSLGLIGHVLLAVAVLPVYALRGGHALPIRSAIIGLGVTVIVGGALIPTLGVRALALGSTVGIIVMAIDLLRRVRRDVMRFGSLSNHILKTSLAGACAAVPALAVVAVLGGADGPVTLAVGAMTVLVAYFAVARAVGIGELDILVRLTIRRFSRS